MKQNRDRNFFFRFAGPHLFPLALLTLALLLHTDRAAAEPCFPAEKVIATLQNQTLHFHQRARTSKDDWQGSEGLLRGGELQLTPLRDLLGIPEAESTASFVARLEGESLATIENWPLIVAAPLVKVEDALAEGPEQTRVWTDLQHLLKELRRHGSGHYSVEIVITHKRGCGWNHILYGSFQNIRRVQE